MYLAAVPVVPRLAFPDHFLELQHDRMPSFVHIFYLMVDVFVDIFLYATARFRIANRLSLQMHGTGLQ